MISLQHKVEDLEKEVDRLEKENKNLTDKANQRIEYNMRPEFQESDIVKEFETAISTLNIEM